MSHIRRGSTTRRGVLGIRAQAEGIGEQAMLTAVVWWRIIAVIAEYLCNRGKVSQHSILGKFKVVPVPTPMGTGLAWVTQVLTRTHTRYPCGFV